MYIVLEIQKSSETQVATLVNSFENMNDALSKYHLILSAAAISSVPLHSAALISERGKMLKYEYYDHTTPDETPAAEE